MFDEIIPVVKSLSIIWNTPKLSNADVQNINGAMAVAKTGTKGQRQINAENLATMRFYAIMTALGSLVHVAVQTLVFTATTRDWVSRRTPSVPVHCTCTGAVHHLTVHTSVCTRVYATDGPCIIYGHWRATRCGIGFEYGGWIWRVGLRLECDTWFWRLVNLGLHWLFFHYSRRRFLCSDA